MRTRRPASPGAIAGASRRRVEAAAPLVALIIASCVALGGCATPGSVPEAAAPPPAAEGAMLDDLAAALAQLHTPRATTIQVTRGDDALTEAFVERLAAAGYGIQRVDADQGAHHLALERDRAEGEGGERLTRLALAVGVTDLERRYRVAKGRAVPASALVVGGTRRPIRLDDEERFGPAADATLARVDYLGTAPVLASTPLISLITDDVVAGVAREASGGAGGPTLAAVNSSRVEVANLFYDDGGAFGALRDTFEPAERTVVVFPNDSMRLGQDGKRQIEDFIEAFREETDMIGLVGCSNGPTALEIGNEGLALGRSRRVAEELTSLGVARERVIDEGCWAPVNARDRFPSRGVVMEILRRAS